jgi:hypothetical protein
VLHLLVVVASLGISLKLILIPLGILAFLAFLLLLGAFGLFCALAIIGGIGWVFGRLTGRPRERRAAAGGRPIAAAGRRLLLRK